MRHLIYWEAFQECSTERYLGMTPGPIPGSKIREYLAWMGFEGELAQRVFHAVRLLDRAFLDYNGRAMEKK